MTTVLDRVSTERISAQARDVHPGRTLLTLIAGVFYLSGWLAYKVSAVLWFAGVWCMVAVREGWRESKKADTAQHARVSRGPS